MITKLHLKKALFTVLLASGLLSNAQTGLELNGFDEYVTTTAPAIEEGASRTVEAWINCLYDSSQRFIVDMGAMTGAGNRFSFKINPGASNIRVEIGGGGLNGSTNVTDQQWHHVAVVYDNSLSSNKYKLYVDGQLDTEGDITTTLNTISSNIFIGSRNDETQPFDGKIDEVRVWNVARSTTEISDYYNTTLCGNEIGLVAYYQFNEGTADSDNTAITTISDITGSGYNGTLHNFSLTGTYSNFVEGATLTETVDNTVTLDEGTLTATEEGEGYQWCDCANSNAAIEDATAQSFTPETSGNYAVQITSVEGCVTTSPCTYVETTMGLEDVLKSNLKMYPNPASENITVDLGAHYQTINAQLVTITGKVLGNYSFQNTNNFTVNIEAVQTGIYFMNFQVDGSENVSVKFIKE